MTERKKAPRESQVKMRELVMPNHTNPQNTIFGGIVMSWIDIAAAMCASRHAERPVVTARVDALNFKAPVKVGEHVVIRASVNYVGKTSMEVGVKVERENPYTGDRKVTTTAYLTFVALDEHGSPVPVIGVDPVTADDKRRYKNAKERVKARKELIAKLKKENN